MRAPRGAAQVRLAMVGAGAFAAFAAGAVAALPEVALAAVADPVAARREETARAWQEERRARGLPAPPPALYRDHRELLAAGPPDVVWVLAPPHLHHPLAAAALAAGCHVFLEKPGSLTLEQMGDLAARAAAARLAVGVDFVMRRNPIYRFLAAAAEAGALGPPERFALENHARADHLPPGHWFWDEERSGGIWVEHGVHFFDLAHWLLGPAAAVAALAGGPDAVACTVLHPAPGGPALAGHYHGFTRPAPAEGALLSLAWQRAHAAVAGWIAVRLEAHVLVDEEGEAALAALAAAHPWLRLRPARTAAGPGDAAPPPSGEEWPGGWANPLPPELTVRGVRVPVRRHLVLTGDLGDRREVYREAVRAGLADLLAAAARPDRRPAVGLPEARAALQVALAARRAQREGRRVTLT